MNKLTQRILMASTAAVVLAGASFTAFARGDHGNCGGDMKGPQAEKMQQRMQDHMAKRQADLKAALKLTAEQEGAWTAFTAAAKPPMMDAKNRPNHEEMAKLTTPQRMEKMQALKAERDSHMTKVMEATKTFYSALTPEQQKVFDEQGNRSHRGGKGGMFGSHGHHG